ncbi:MAG: thioredoxin-dependent peroxiredoxin [Acidobacteriota bacterium]|jgi:peroxiredoxin|nr:thioredoxin-dependent peroxiredoxin [Acidobacteriota bacterium]
MNTNVGASAPDFTLKDGEGKDWRLSDQRGRVVVLLFYPGDETPVCTKQLCSVRDKWEQYRATGAEVVGVSTDSVESHRKFAANHSLPLRLLSDPDRRVAEMFGAKSWLPGRAARAVVVVDAEGRVRHNKAQALSLFRPTDDAVLDAIRAAQAPA